MSASKKGVTGDPRWNNSGGLWLQSHNEGPRWKGSVQIDGVVYELQGYGSDQQKNPSERSPTIKLKAKPKEVY